MAPSADASVREHTLMLEVSGECSEAREHCPCADTPSGRPRNGEQSAAASGARIETTPDLLSVLKEGAERTPYVMEGPDSDWTPILMHEDASGVYRTAAIPGMTPDTVTSAA